MYKKNCKFYYLTALNGPLINCFFFVELPDWKRQSVEMFSDQNALDMGI